MNFKIYLKEGFTEHIVMSSNRRLERLQKNIDSKEKDWNLLLTKCQELSSACLIEVDPATKFKLEVQIKETEEELEKLELQIDQLERQLNDLERASSGNLEQSNNFEQLHGALLKLGYEEQHRPFRKILKDHALGSFLIQGSSSEYGQRWLLNRLAISITDIIDAKKVKIDLAQVSSRTDVPALWRKLAGQVKLSGDSSYDDVAARVCEWWKTQNVLIIFNNVHATVEENLQDLFHDFWLVIFNKAQELNLQQGNFKLLMFLVDYKGEVRTWNLNFARQYNASWQSSIPMELPKILPFSTDKLMTWIEQQSEVLPAHLSDDVEETVQSLLALARSGIPEPTFREICNLCGCSWDDQEEIWQQL
ncbi:MAG: hypothetical protein F6K31_38075 [Symploca sp. SIO2G7]|nr:hypothetical protein [Symploca sp. SIO2G7]